MPLRNPDWAVKDLLEKTKLTSKTLKKRVLSDRSKHGNRRVVHLSYDPSNIEAVVENQRTFIRTFVLKHRL